MDDRFGIFTSPAHKGIPIGIRQGVVWAAENEAFTRVFGPVDVRVEVRGGVAEVVESPSWVNAYVVDYDDYSLDEAEEL